MIAPEQSQALEFRVRGRVQGVGFRPTVWHIARALGLAGEVLNDGDGVLLRVGGDEGSINALLDGIERKLPRLARIDRVERRQYAGDLPREFRIAESAGGGAHTQVAPDAAICPACVAELRDPRGRRFRYPFTNCTHCGPRLSIVTAIPYDRAATTMAGFALCDACRTEYRNPDDRRFHAEPIACPTCGPAVALIALDDAAPPVAPETDAIEAAVGLIRSGEIVAVKGLGGYHLACDATNADAVARLRRAKRRDAKPFALMARDLAVIRRYCTVVAEEERQLTSVPAPIVLLRADGASRLPETIAPSLRTLGFMLPTTPLHLLLIADFSVPLVMTSGNLSEEPTVIDDDDARRRLGSIAAYAVMHDRTIANRVDDSVVRIMDGKSRLLRRARGFAPAPVKLPTGFERAPDLLAMGGELKATFCLVKDGQAILSQHQGDLENAPTFDDYRNTLTLFRQLFDHSPAALIVDRHPEYLSSKFARAEAQRYGLPLLEVQHHHAHVAACLAENGYPLHAQPALGIVLDGLGFGDDGTIWGGEFLLADYRGYERLAMLKPVAMPGGAQAVREPWRNLYAHLASAMGWEAFASRYCGLELHAYLRGKPRALLDVMIAKGINAPKASSCGRLFDAVAAALGAYRERQAYEGEAAGRLEALAAQAPHDNATAAYRFDVSRPSHGKLIELDPALMWNAILCDLERDVSASTMARRFHQGLSQALVEMTMRLAQRETGRPRFDTVALSGGCFQNRILFESVAAQLGEAGFVVLAHAEVPANDGGLSLGQAAIGAARLINANANANGRVEPCVSAFQAASSG
jgi:hydrogenase maturation protein HypF